MYYSTFINLLLCILIQTIGSELANKECRCFPHEDCWPSAEEWNTLNDTVHGRLLIPVSPVDACIQETGHVNSDECKEELENLGKDPYYIQTLAGGTESTGQARGWKAMISNYAIEAMDELDIAAGVRFATKHNLRVVVKGTGHDYYGRSNAADSLLIWTHSMRNMTFYENFVPNGCKDDSKKWGEGIPAVTMEAGLTWMDVYAAATQDRDLFVQGGGCTSVGVVGWYIGGGYGSLSKKFGSGPANMLEVKVVTAEGDIVIANECQNSDLFFALRGGGYGFGIVISITARSHPQPKLVGGTTGSIKCRDENATLDFIAAFLDFYNNDLVASEWGEQLSFSGNDAYLGFTSLLSEEEAREAWKPLENWLLDRQDAYEFDISHYSMPFKLLYNAKYQHIAGHNPLSPFDPREPNRTFFWNGNIGELSAYWMSYYSRFLMNADFMEDVNSGAKRLRDLYKDFAGGAAIHFNKAQYGATKWAVEELENTPMHPSIKDSFGLIIAGALVSHYSPLVPNYLQNDTSTINDIIDYCGTTDLDDCWALDNNDNLMNKFREQTPKAGAYFNEADYFEPNFQETFWGKENYDALVGIKNHWDPNGLFYCHNCVGSEEWEEGGMCRK